MVLEYYKLREQPFGVTPDSRFLFLSPTHREALGSLLYGVDAGCGFLALIAKPGLGKTTLLFYALQQLKEKALTVFLFQTVCTSMDLLRALLTGLGVHETQGSLIQMQLRLKEVLIAQARLGKRVVAVIDEAQNLDDSVLELIRMLSNFETPQEKLIQIILSGQPQLAEKIASPDLEQLRQRISMFACLKPFSREDTQLYIDHRLRIAGYSLAWPLFTKDALALIAEHSGGIPRNINNLCFNSLSLACALQRKPIDSDIIREVIADLDLGRFKSKGAVAAPPAKREQRAALAFRPAASTVSKFAGWIPAFALALAVILLLVGVLFAGRWWPGNKAAMHAESVPPLVAPAPSPVNAPPRAASAGAAGQAGDAAPPLVVPDLPSSGTGESPRAVPPTSTISVKPGETLLEICVASFGRCDPELLKQIRKVNPGLNNPDHIESGQTIHLPVSGGISGQPDKASIPGRDKP